MTSRPSPDGKPQLDKFKDLARELKADENAKHFEQTVRKIAKAPKAPAKDERDDPA